MQIKYKEKILEIEQGSKIKDIFKDEISNNKYPVIGAKFNNKYQRLDYEILQDGEVELIDIASKQGMNIYKRTLIFILSIK